MEHRLHSGYFRGELRGGGDDWDEVVLHEVKQVDEVGAVKESENKGEDEGNEEEDANENGSGA